MSNSKQVTLRAPMHGVIIPIENVPDPVFAEKMVGDGISIDPIEGILRAPCDGEILHLHDSNHAVTLKTMDNLEILLHIGLDTVMLKGEGFTPIIKSGDLVKAGDELILFDMKTVGKKAPYLLTQMIISTMDLVEKIEPVDESKISAGDPVCKVYLSESSNSQVEEDKVGESIESEPIALPNPVGLHARPAAVLVKIAKKYRSKIEVNLGDIVANAKSVTSLMKLDSKYGDKVVISATGIDAEMALSEIVPEVISGLGDAGCIPVTEIATTKQVIFVPEITEESGDHDSLIGSPASRGLATGTVFLFKEPELNIPQLAGSLKEEQERLKRAIIQAESELKDLYNKLEVKDPGKAAIFSAHLEILEDPDLLDSVNEILTDGVSAASAWDKGYKIQAEDLAALESVVLSQRANDMRDVGKRVLASLLGVTLDIPDFPKGSILIAEDLTPSITANLDPSIVNGLCTTLGGATSHVAILARSLGIPAVVGIDNRALLLKNGDKVVINGTKGELKLNPDENYITKINYLQAKTSMRKQAEKIVCKESAVTTDDFTVEVVGNVGNPMEAKDIPGLGGEGIGLLRSEFLFQDRSTEPSENEQYEVYKTVIEAVGSEAPVVIRTLDVGGDKPLSYLPLPKEDNPFLGERGIRVGLNRPEMLRTQLRALLRASVYGKLHIMFPMVGDLQEWRSAKAILDEERIILGVSNVSVGIMIEVPSAALLADKFAKEVDFFSIGTNDLTQYTMAIDRGHPKLAANADGLHPSVLRLIKMTIDAAHKEGKWAGICGGLGGDPQAVPILVGLGIDELSISIPSIPSVKAQIRSLSKSECEKLAKEALEMDTAQNVRKISPSPYTDEDILNG